MQLDPKHLASIETIRVRAKALAMLDAIISPEWDERYYSFDTNWSAGEEMASMRNGCGDDWFILFGPFGAAIKGLDHETTISADSIFAKEITKQLPESFSPFYNETAFSMDQISYCYWHPREDDRWKKVTHPDATLSNATDGSIEHLALLHESSLLYQEFASEYCEIELALHTIDKVYSFTPLTDQIVKSLNPDLALSDAIEFSKEIGYPVADIPV